MPVLRAVCRIASAMSRFTASGKSAERPITSRRILFLWIVGSSRFRYSRSSRIRKSTSPPGAPPILQRERIQRQARQMQSRARLDDLAGHLHSGAMPRHAWQMPPLGPAPVAVHNDRHVMRQAFAVELFQQLRFLATGWIPEVGVFHGVIFTERSSRNSVHDMASTKKQLKASSLANLARPARVCHLAASGLPRMLYYMPCGQMVGSRRYVAYPT